MSPNVKTMVLATLAASCVVSVGWASENLMRLSMERDAIFTPGQVRVAVQLSDRAEVAGPYKAKLTAFLAGIVVREQTVGITQEAPATFVVPFPKVLVRSEVRCRVELSLNDEFLEAVERPVCISPPAAPLDKHNRPTDVWVLDASGGLQRVFHELDVNAVDAAFQGVRDFASPSVVFMGEFSETNVMELITARLSQMPKQPIVIFLRQRQFPKALEVKAVDDVNAPRSIICDMNTPLLKDLTRADMLNLLSKAVSIETKAKSGFTHSFVTERADNQEPARTYLSTLNADGRLHVFCQLPVMDPCDPRQTTMLHNLIEFAATPPSSQRRIP